MPIQNLPEPFAGIDAMVERGEYQAARDSLAALTVGASSASLIELLGLKLALKEGTLRPQVVMNRLLALMRTDAKIPGANDLYREASQLSYSEGTSSLSHSHPPPPIKMKDD
jgi:hypothetical protein